MADTTSAIVTPAIGAYGLYKLSPPFDTVLLPGMAYTCKAIRTLADVIAEGKDPYATFYKPYSIDPTKYQADAAQDVTIVSLLSATGKMEHVPSTYVLSFPSVGGTPYRVMGLVVQLEALPDSVDLSPIHTQIQNLVKDTLGITAAITDVVLSDAMLLDSNTARATETARQAAISNHTTDTARLQDALDQLASAQQQLAVLQDYIAANLAPAA